MGVCTTCGQEWPDDFKLCPNDGSSLRAETDETNLVGSVIADRYHIKSKLGEGEASLLQGVHRSDVGCSSHPSRLPLLQVLLDPFRLADQERNVPTR